MSVFDDKFEKMCPKLKNHGLCELYPEWMSKHCSKTCYDEKWMLNKNQSCGWDSPPSSNDTNDSKQIIFMSINKGDGVESCKITCAENQICRGFVHNTSDTDSRFGETGEGCWYFISNNDSDKLKLIDNTDKPNSYNCYQKSTSILPYNHSTNTTPTPASTGNVADITLPKSLKREITNPMRLSSQSKKGTSASRLLMNQLINTNTDISTQKNEVPTLDTFKTPPVKLPSPKKPTINTPMKNPSPTKAKSVNSPMKKPSPTKAKSVNSPMKKPSPTKAKSVNSPMKKPSPVKAKTANSPMKNPSPTKAKSVDSPMKKPSPAKTKSTNSPMKNPSPRKK